MKKLGILAVLLIVFFLVASASALTQNFGATSGNSEYKGAIAINEDGSIAVTVAAVADGTLTANGITKSDTVGASASQSGTEIEGDAALAVSMASNGGNTASTGDLAAGDNAEVDTSQGAGADVAGAGAGQDSMVAGDVAIAGSAASSSDSGTSAETVAVVEDGIIADTSQGAGVLASGEVGAGQDTIADGEVVNIASTASDGGDTNTASTVAGGTDVSVVSYQHVEAVPDTSASAEQDSLILGGAGATAFTATVVESEEGRHHETSAETHNAARAGTGILVIETSQEGIAEDDLAAAGQESVVAGSAFAAAGSSAKSDDGDRAETVAVAYHGGGVATLQGAVAGEGSFGPIEVEGAAAAQLSEITAFDGAVARSSASNRHADEGAAETEAAIHGAGGIETIQGAAAGEVDLDLLVLDVDTEGAVAAQASDLHSTEGGHASSRATNEFDNFADTDVGYSGAGFIDGTIQGAAAGEVEVELFGHDIAEAEGAVAIQHTDTVMSLSQNGGVYASSSSNNEDENFAGTGAGATGSGAFIEDTTQGAGAGEVEILGFEAEGAIAAQDTELIGSGSDGVASADSWSLNEGDNWASTGARAENGYITDTTQGAAAGEVEFNGFEAEGAIAIQHTDEIETYNGVASAYSRSNNEWENFASTETGVSALYIPDQNGGITIQPGIITDTTQGAAAGEVEFEGSFIDVEAEGAVAIQDTEGITGLNGFAQSDSSSSDPVTAHTEARFFGIGSIDDTTQGAAAGEVEVELFGFEVEAEGAAAAQHTDEIQSNLGGFAASTATSTGNDEGSAGTFAAYGPAGSISGTTQGAGAGEVELEVFGNDVIELEGAIAAQHTDEIASDTFGAAASWANNEDENFALTGAVFFGPGDIDETTQGGAAGEIEIFGHEVAEGAVVGQFTDNIASENGGGVGALAVSEDGDFALTAAAYLSDGSIDDTFVGAAAGEVDVGDVFIFDDIEVEGAAAFQHTDRIEDEFGAFTVSVASQEDADEGFAVTTNGFLFGEGHIVETTQGAGAGEIEFEVFGIDVETEGAIAAQHTNEIDSNGLGWAASFANNEFDNFAGTATVYTFGGEIIQTTQGATAGEIELEFPNGEDLELEGAAAGQFTEFARTTGPGFSGTGAFHSPSDFDFTGPGFVPPGSSGGPLFGIAAAGEIEDGFFIDGAIAFP